MFVYLLKMLFVICSEDMLGILYDKEEGGEPLAGALLQEYIED